MSSLVGDTGSQRQGRSAKVTPPAAQEARKAPLAAYVANRAPTDEHESSNKQTLVSNREVEPHAVHTDVSCGTWSTGSRSWTCSPSTHMPSTAMSSVGSTRFSRMISSPTTRKSAVRTRTGSSTGDVAFTDWLRDRWPDRSTHDPLHGQPPDHAGRRSGPDRQPQPRVERGDGRCLPLEARKTELGWRITQIRFEARYFRGHRRLLKLHRHVVGGKGALARCIPQTWCCRGSHRLRRRWPMTFSDSAVNSSAAPGTRTM